MTYIITEIQIINNKEITVRSDLSSIITHLHDHYNLDTNRMNLLEIGTFLGESTFYFSKYFKHVFTVDTYQLWEDFPDREQIFLNNLKNFSNISKIKMESTEASSFFRDKSFDFLYIDGCHEFDSVNKDFSSWFPKVKDNGFIAGHDYFLPEEINEGNASWSKKVTGVYNFVNKYLGKPELVKNTNWLFKKENLIDKYNELVKENRSNQILSNLTGNKTIINCGPKK